MKKKEARKLYNQKRIDLNYSDKLKWDDLILINDGDLSQRLTHPSNKNKKRRRLVRILVVLRRAQISAK